MWLHYVLPINLACSFSRSVQILSTWEQSGVEHQARRLHTRNFTISHIFLFAVGKGTVALQLFLVRKNHQHASHFTSLFERQHNKVNNSKMCALLELISHSWHLTVTECICASDISVSGQPRQTKPEIAAQSQGFNKCDMAENVGGYPCLCFMRYTFSVFTFSQFRHTTGVLIFDLHQQTRN
jgi:hypothetical protein